MGVYKKHNKVCENGQSRNTPASSKQIYMLNNLGIQFEKDISLRTAQLKIKTKLRQLKNINS